MITIRVIRRDTRATVSGKRVKISGSGRSAEGYTSSNGDVHFDVPNGRYAIYIDGGRQYEGPIVGVQIVSI
jgi:hypothetical protein